MFLEGIDTRIVNVYAPSDARQRIVFVKKLRVKKYLKKGDIVLGDFNCVPDTALDVRYSDESGKTGADYPNRGGRETEALLSDIGLVDAFREHRGHARAYSHRTSTVYTRIDRV